MKKGFRGTKSEVFTESELVKLLNDSDEWIILAGNKGNFRQFCKNTDISDFALISYFLYINPEIEESVQYILNKMQNELPDDTKEN